MSSNKPSVDEQNKNRRILQQLLTSEDNRECADCTAKGPLWAAVNHGVFLCIRCAGIHRGMGTHVSKVRSVTLDSWTADQVEMMQRFGNRRANEYLEANFPPNKSKPSETASPSVIEQFCRAKYEKKIWIARDGPPPRREQPERPTSSSGRRDEPPKPRPPVQREEYVKPPTPVSPPTKKPIQKPVQQREQPIQVVQKSENDLLSFDNAFAPTATTHSSHLEELITSGFSNAPTTPQKQSNQKSSQNILSLFDAPQQQPMQPQHFQQYGQQQQFFGQQVYRNQQPMQQQGMPYGAPQPNPYSQFKF